MKIEEDEVGWLLTPETKVDHDFLHNQWDFKGWSIKLPKRIVKKLGK